jgi:hypothetical protein
MVPRCNEVKNVVAWTSYDLHYKPANTAYAYTKLPDKSPYRFVPVKCRATPGCGRLAAVRGVPVGWQNRDSFALRTAA